MVREHEWNEKLIIFTTDLIGDIAALLNCCEAESHANSYFQNLDETTKAIYLQRILDYMKQNTEEVLWLSKKLVEELAETK